MARQRTVPDADIFAIVRSLLRDSGDRAVTFSVVAAQSGLSGASLVQRYTNREGMVQAARLAGWDGLDAALAEADATAPDGADGAAALLKTLGTGTAGADLGLLMHDLAACAPRADGWKTAVETALARRMGDPEAARAAFALWQGRLLWAATGGKGPKLRAAVERLAVAKPAKPAKDGKPKKEKAAKSGRKARAADKASPDKTQPKPASVETPT